MGLVITLDNKPKERRLHVVGAVGLRVPGIIAQ